MANILHQKNREKFECNFCHFKCSKKGDFHDIFPQQNIKKMKWLTKYRHIFTSITSHDKYVCECGREYKHRSSLSKHRNNCIYLFKNNLINMDISNNINNLNELNDPNIDNVDNVKNPNIHNLNLNNLNNLNNKIISKKDERDDVSKDLIVKVLQENSDIKEILVKQYETMQNQQRALENQQQQLQELIPKVGNNTVNNVKQKFNINIFLNEKCRDAINIDDFIKQINISLDNLELTKSKGLSEGLSNLLIENISKLSVYERPLHCTDSKRETLYIKDNNVWEKDEDKSKFKSILNDLSKIQYKNVKQWIDANPDYMDNPDKQEYFIDLVRRCSSSLVNVDSKIIKKVCNNINIRDEFNDD